MSIRSTAKAIIIDNGKILLNRCLDKKNGEYYSLPGGGQKKYETFNEAVVRECLEETGYTVTPVRFAALCETICDDENYRKKYPDYMHKVYHIFICRLEGAERCIPTETDDFQVESVWIDKSVLPSVRLLPKAVGQNILSIIDGQSPLFLGSEHINFNHG